MSYQETLRDIVLSDDRFVVLTAENRISIRDIIPDLGNRFIDTGITEQALIGTAAGLALRGRIPVVHGLSAFLTMRAFEFIRTDVGLPDLPVKLCGGVPGFLSEANGPTHQALEDVALMRMIPNMQIFCPADEEDLVIGLRTLLLSPHPCYIRLNHRKPAVTHDPAFGIGKAEVISAGEDITIITYGMLLSEAFAAAEILQRTSSSVRLINLRTVKPVDEEVILSAAEETDLIVTVEDHFKTGGLYGIVCEVLISNGLMCDVLPVSLENSWFRPALLEEVLDHAGMTGQKLAGRIFEYKKGGRSHAEQHRIQ